ncbi:uncharacterized protein [Haliotis cracherodii]|uniref:uncharacterized protein n=1 Tax=Haliotis cracherodii TaxID=6455 RepID=UPI0039E98617
MAVLRWIYRRRRVFFFIFCASSFWIAYLYLSLPSPKDKRAKDYINYGPVGSVVSYQKVKVAEPPPIRVYTPARHEVIQKPNLVLDPPPQLPQNQSDIINRTALFTQLVNKENVTLKKDGMFKDWMNIGNVGAHIKNKTYEMGARFKNKTYEVAESVKNKTLQHLAVFGMGKDHNLVRYIFEPHRWNLTVSFEDIGNIMKDTEFLNKLHPLDLSAPVLSSSKNRTANYTYNMPFHVGFCDCYEHHCVCCARIANKRLHLNSTTCTNFTFVSKSQEIVLEVLLDSKPIYKNVVSAELPPLVCLGTYPKVVDICIHFFNLTFKVNFHHEHKTQLLGCTDFSLNLYNKTIGSFPVDCFQIPGDPNHKHKDSLNLFNFPNWMP